MCFGNVDLVDCGFIFGRQKAKKNKSQYITFGFASIRMGVIMNDKVMVIVSTWGDKLPKSAPLLLQERLQKLPEDKLSHLSLIQLKDPIVGLVLGVCLGIVGADRFYKGDIVLGVVKFLLCWLTFGIWAIVDLFLVWKGIKQDNLNKISHQLMMFGV